MALKGISDKKIISFSFFIIRLNGWRGTRWLVWDLKLVFHVWPQLSILLAHNKRLKSISQNEWFNFIWTFVRNRFMNAIIECLKPKSFPSLWSHSLSKTLKSLVLCSLQGFYNLHNYILWKVKNRLLERKII